MNEVTSIISTPKYHSDVPWFDIYATADIQPECEITDGIAHNEFLDINIWTAGGNIQFKTVDYPRVVIMFTMPDTGILMSGIHEGIVYASIPAYLQVTELVLVENLSGNKPEMLGINLDIWVRNEDDAQSTPFCSIVITPLEPLHVN